MRLCDQFLQFILDIILQRNLLWELIKHELVSRYLGSYLGLLWAFIQPTITLFIFWFVFQVGFKTVPIGNAPFVPWLMCGMIPWFFLSDSIIAATTAVKDNSFLVRKVAFRVSMLPLVKIGAVFLVHIIFVGVLVGVLFAYGIKPNLFWLQIPYYMFASLVLACGIGWLTSSVIIFLPDVGQLTTMLLQFLFWLTPIFWPPSLIPSHLSYILLLNPFHYIVNGYRSGLIDQSWFWQNPGQTAIFWGITSGLFILGAVVFRRLRPHFADVL